MLYSYWTCCENCSLHGAFKIMEMDDIINTIKSILPQISKTQLQLIETRLTEIGVETIENLRYITSEDLSDIVKVVPARKLITSIQKKFEDTGTHSDIESTDRDSSTILYNSPASSGAGSSFSDDIPESSQRWAESYRIPWEKFPKLLLDQCIAKKRPDEYLRRESIRILVDDIRQFCQKPTGRDIHTIAARFVDKYKDSLGDYVLGKVIGNGYSSAMANIKERLNNLNRKSVSVTDDEREELSKVSSKTYGCINWSIDIDQDKEDELNRKKDWMKQEFVKTKNMTCRSTIMEYMLDTYPLQRKIINSGTTFEVKQEFPYLFDKDVISTHFQTLTGHLLQDYLKAEKRKYNIIHCLRSEKSNRLQTEIREMDMNVKEVNPHIKLVGFIKILMAYFKEDSLLEYYQPCVDMKEVEAVSRNNGAPVIAVIGDLYTTKLFHVVLENKIITTVHAIDDAVMILFGTYYIFNLEYHTRASQTLEFIQRALIGINPHSGSKKPRKNNKGSVSSKVVWLASHINDL